jgi:hypothetical protein
MRLMREWTVVATFLALSLAVPRVALATVNHGDFLGIGVDFLQVSETTQTLGDPEPIWNAPTLSGTGTQLLFTPTLFISSCVVGGTSDTTASQLTMTIASQPGGHIETIALVEAGDTRLQSIPPFGTPATNSSAALSGTATVTETTSGPITPVVIPFTGTFLPSATFALPANSGPGFNWSGSISIDVLSAVPLATVVELSLQNSLAVNCGPGITNARIQKKSVAGPTVAILVNPLECELELDKTCCIPQPSLPDLGECEGDMESITLEYTGGSCKRSNNHQGKSFCCHGYRKLGDPADIWLLDWQGTVVASDTQDIMIGEEVVFSSSTGVLPSRTKIKVKDDWHHKQYVEIDTSCKKSVECDDRFGPFTVTGFESTLGGEVDCDAPPPPGDCVSSGDPAATPCDAKLIDMVLEYNGQDCQVPLPNPQNGEAECSGDATGATDVNVVYTGMFPSRQTVSPASGINDGDRIRVTATFWGGLFPNQKFQLSDSSGVIQTIEFHVSCSQPLFLGDEFGSFKLVEWKTKEGTELALGDPIEPQDACEIPLSPPGPHCTSDLQSITLVYIGDFLGEGCTVSNSQGGYASCDGVDDPGDPVDVTPSGSITAAPDEDVEFGELVTISPAWGGDLPGIITFDVTGAGGSQEITIKTSCYKPLSLGDRFGSFVVFGMDREDDGPIALGGEIQYQYTVTNPGTETIGNVSIDDDQLGNIVSGETLLGSESKTFTANGTLLGTTTNVATATGDVDGDVCDPGADSLVVTVLAPPQSSFKCSEPIKELTVIWNGAQTVDVKVWKGAAGTSTLVGTFEDVAPGDVIEATGLGTQGTSSTFQIFTSNGVTLLGESKFNLWCDDKHMNGLEDCGKNLGNSKYDQTNLINDWLLEGMVDSNETLSCTPGVVGAPPDCGFGPELMVVLPGLMWLHRRRLRRRE